MADEQQDQPKIHIDSDWKAQARAEKERLAKKAKPAPPPGSAAEGAGESPGATSGASGTSGAAEGAGAGGASEGAMPPANFETLLSTLATQALFAMGAIADPRTGQRYQNPGLARHHIDMLGVLEEKTKGNLTEEEANILAATLYELRTRYVQIASRGNG